MEFIERIGRFGRQALNNSRLAHCFQQAVAAHTALKGSDVLKQMIMTDNLGQPAFGPYFSHKVPIGHNAAFEQTDIPCQQNALFFRGDARKFLIQKIVAVQRIKPQHAQIRRQAAQVRIQHEAYLPTQRRAQRNRGNAIHSGYARINPDTISGLHDIAKVNSSAVDEDEFDFGMRDTKRLDHILDRGLPIERVLDFVVAVAAGQEEVEFVVKAKVGVMHIPLVKEQSSVIRIGSGLML